MSNYQATMHQPLVVAVDILLSNLVSQGTAVTKPKFRANRRTGVTVSPFSHKDSFDLVYKEQVPQLVRVATLILGSQAQAEEVVHDAFVKLHGQWSEIENPPGFLRRVVVNQSRDIVRRRAVKQKYLTSLKREVKESKQSFEISADAQHLHSVLGQLKFKRRTVVVLRYFGGYSLREISEMMDIPEGTVTSNLRRGITELRALMK